MKKTFNPSDLQRQEGKDHARRLYKLISEGARSLDDARAQSHSVCDLFAPVLRAQRSRLKENCERLIFLDPVLYGKKAEELLWRKIYYDVVSSAKRLKSVEYTADDVVCLQGHINSGIGHYHHYLSRLQLEYKLDLRGVVDFSVAADENEKSTEMRSPELDIDPEIMEWRKFTVHRSLIYLGDLCRYKLDIYPNWDPSLAMRYYLQAYSYFPDYGMPHNQLGTLSAGWNYSLDSVYYYMKSLSCSHTFDGTENNLQRLFEKNSHVFDQLPVKGVSNLSDSMMNIKNFIVRFLFLSDVWYYNKKISDLHAVCHQAIVDFQDYLSYNKASYQSGQNSPTEVDSCETDSITSPSFLNPDIVFKVVTICLLCIDKQENLHKEQLSTSKAFLLALYAQLVQNAIDQIESKIFGHSLFDCTTEHPDADEKGKKRSKIKKLRRKRRKSDEESDQSDSEVVFNEAVDSDESNDISGNENTFGSSSENETDCELNGNAEISQNAADGTKANEFLSKITESIRKMRRFDINVYMQILSDDGLLQSIKIISDWLTIDADIWNECGPSMKILLKKIACLVNLLYFDTNKKNICSLDAHFKEVIADSKIVPLPEDIELKSIPILKQAQKHLVWNYDAAVGFKYETLIRSQKLTEFCHFLRNLSCTGLLYSEKTHLFEVQEDFFIDDDELVNVQVKDTKQENEKNMDKPESRGKLMQHMGQLWLAAEIRDLESRVQGQTALSPYLVLDTDALINYSHLAKQLAYSRKFIVIIPFVVVSALDELKRDTIKAREAIRWLENQFNRGNRFLRAQRPQEKAVLPLIKYPKKKNKEAFAFVQIVECCNFFMQQQQKSEGGSLVTLLTGNKAVLTPSEAREISFVGLVKSVDVCVELITAFHAKWKKSNRVHQR